jgi:hypothetical protein
MKILIFLITLAVFSFTSNRANAYWNVFGVSIPSNPGELRATFIKVTGQKPPKAPIKTPKKLETAVENAKEAAKYWSIPITEKQINDAIKQYAVGNTYLHKYHITGGSVDLGENSFTAEVSLKDGVKLYGKFELNETKNGVIIKKIENKGEKDLSIVEMTLLKEVIKRGPQIALRYFPQYKKSFSHATITSSKVEFWFLTKEFVK